MAIPLPMPHDWSSSWASITLPLCAASTWPRRARDTPQAADSDPRRWQGWHSQVSHFASLPGYQVLVHDNRGVGNSDSPKGLYKTSEMAKDVVELLEEVGWVAKDGAEGRVHVVGVSMGGMIALELVRCPHSARETAGG